MCSVSDQERQSAHGLDALGRVSVLIAPNHFHHLALPAFRARYPQARVLAASGAIPRLRAKGHAGLEPIEDATLPPGLRACVAEGTRTGETFLVCDDGIERSLLVCDAFFHVNTPVRGLVGAFLHATQTTPGLKMGRTFKYMALADAAAYRRWATETLRGVSPQRVLFSHGEPLVGTDVVPRLLAAIDERLGRAGRP